jgi:hypothetical protein
MGNGKTAVLVLVFLWYLMQNWSGAQGTFGLGDCYWETETYGQGKVATNSAVLTSG